MKKYFVEIQDKNDFDYIMVQSQFFDTIDCAKNWFKSLEWFDRDKLTASIMSAELNENNEIDDDILFEEEL